MKPPIKPTIPPVSRLAHNANGVFGNSVQRSATTSPQINRVLHRHQGESVFCCTLLSCATFACLLRVMVENQAMPAQRGGTTTSNSHQALGLLIIFAIRIASKTQPVRPAPTAKTKRSARLLRKIILCQIVG